MVFNFALRLLFLLCLGFGSAQAASPGPGSSLVCPNGWICVLPTGTIADETNVQAALTSAATTHQGVMLFPGTYDICSQMNWPTGVDISGIVWHNDDPISNSFQITNALTVVTCKDGTFSRFTNGQAFFSGNNHQNQSLHNIQFYGMFYQGLTTPLVNCVNVNTLPGTAGGSVIERNSFVGCNIGLSIDGSAGGNAQDTEIAQNLIGINYHSGLNCNSCSDMRIHDNHFANNNMSNHSGDYDLRFSGGESSIIANRFEFQGWSIGLIGAIGVTVTGNDFDKTKWCLDLVGSATSPNEAIAFTGNRCNITSGGNAAIFFEDGGGSASSMKNEGIHIAGNAMDGDFSSFGYSATPMVMFAIQIEDQPAQPAFRDATSMRVLWPFLTFAPNMYNATNAYISGTSTRNSLNLGSTASTGITSETFATDFIGANKSAADLITEDTTTGAHNIVTISGTGGGQGTGLAYTFSAIVKAGATARDIGFKWGDNGSNTIGEIWNPSSCTVVGGYGATGSGALVGAATASALNNGFCFIKATFTLGSSTVVGAANNQIDLCTTTSCPTYTGTTGSVILEEPTFKPCLAASGTAC